MDNDLHAKEWGGSITLTGTKEQMEKAERDIKAWNDYWSERMEEDLASCLFTCSYLRP